MPAAEGRVVALNRQVDLESRASPGWTVDDEAPAECLNAVGQSLQARPSGGIGAADAVVLDPENDGPPPRA